MEYLSKLLPGFLRKKEPETPATSTPSTKQPAKPAAPPAPPPVAAAAPQLAPAPEMLDAIAAFLRQHLVCTDHQINVLALWIVHTWCFDAFASTPYLDIRSPEPQCGKTLCLQLLNALSSGAWLTSGPAPVILMKQLIATEQQFKKEPKKHRTNGVLLLDDRDQTFEARDRQPLVALLNTGSVASSSYLCRLRGGGTEPLNFFYPKAFAGNNRLPRSLAERCIPITLHRKKPSQLTRRFARDQIAIAASRILEWLAEWSNQNFNAFAQSTKAPPAGLPSNLTARQQDAAEPLLHIANRIGGHWPEKTRVALDAVLNNIQTSDAVELLSDVRLVFAIKKNPDHLATKDIISVLSSRESRPWAAWNSRSGRHMAKLLHRFGIGSRNLYFKPEETFKGYRLCDFQDAWERYLPPLPANLAQQIEQQTKQADTVI